MSDIYDQHRAAFSQVSAYVILKDGERVATVAFKFPRDGAGRLYAYVHWLGLEMVRGYAGGYGYDKRSAAVASAQRKIMVPKDDFRSNESAYDLLAEMQKRSCTYGEVYVSFGDEDEASPTGHGFVFVE